MNSGLIVAYCREVIKELIKELKSKHSSLRAIPNVFKPSYIILLAYLFGISGETRIAGRFPVKVAGKNVRPLISLAKQIVKCLKAFYTSDSSIIFSYSDTIFKFSLEDALKNVELLHAYSELCRIGAKLYPHSDEHILVEAPDTTMWVVRRNIPSDINCAVLLPYIGEPYEYGKLVKKRLLRERDLVFVDVGAYIGGYSVRVCRMGVDVVAVEPDPENYNILVKTLN